MEENSGHEGEGTELNLHLAVPGVCYLCPAQRAPARQLSRRFLAGWMLFLADEFLIQFPFQWKQGVEIPLPGGFRPCFPI